MGGHCSPEKASHCSEVCSPARPPCGLLLQAVQGAGSGAGAGGTSRQRAGRVQLGHERPAWRGVESRSSRLACGTPRVGAGAALATQQGHAGCHGRTAGQVRRGAGRPGGGPRPGGAGGRGGVGRWRSLRQLCPGPRAACSSIHLARGKRVEPACGMPALGLFCLPNRSLPPCWASPPAAARCLLRATFRWHIARRSAPTSGKRHGQLGHASRAVPGARPQGTVATGHRPDSEWHLCSTPGPNRAPRAPFTAPDRRGSPGGDSTVGVQVAGRAHP